MRGLRIPEYRYRYTVFYHTCIAIRTHVYVRDYMEYVHSSVHAYTQCTSYVLEYFRYPGIPVSVGILGMGMVVRYRCQID